MKKVIVLSSLIVIVAILFTACGSATPQATPTNPLASATPQATPTNPPASATPPATPTNPLASATMTSGPTTPTPLPWLSPRGYHDAAYDSRCDRVIVYGGEVADYNGNLSYLHDTWTYDLATNTWENMAPPQKLPLASSPWGFVDIGPMVYDDKVDQIIKFMGVISDTSGTGDVLSTKTWAYDCSSNTWSNLSAKGAPSGGLNGERMVYDSKADVMILFGGDILPWPSNGIEAFKNETWAYDFQTNTWTDLNPKVSPPGQNYFPMVYDPVSDKVLAWIQPSNDGANTLWAYDYNQNTWTPHPVDKPSFRYYSGAAYVPTVKKTFFFGGATMDTEAPFNELWTYDSATNTWAQLTSSTGPSARGWATLTYIPKADKLVLIGGGTDRDSFTSEVWVYDIQKRSWTQAEP